MYIENAYTSRDSLSDRDLQRLLSALRDETERYRFTIRNYPPDRMEKHGAPFLARLEARVQEVERLVRERDNQSG
ncbi:hypothetical protein [Caulobacter sp. 17J65-9]|uniref:hypothetical protein n=1 Tax=Caulobacter sp. 17J65-9 TaxID=2709382 RepID=UPI0013C941FA|nr:hypothetical protein [Caulobacter sp. 17J65-9]NEX92899.1 hypothetical protein [Caulobacter sp. 17J65-9]